MAIAHIKFRELLETPEEDNTVTQTSYTIKEIWEVFDEIITKQGTDVMLKTALAMLPRHIKFNRVNSKVVETTKEQPNLCECCKIHTATTAKNMCKQCSKYW